MRRFILLLAGSLLFGSFVAVWAADKKKPLSAAEVFKRSAPGIVAIDCLGENGTRLSTASGFLVSDNGKIVTNFHVIQSCHSLVVRLANSDTYDFTNVMEIDPRKDLALIRIKAASLKTLPLGESNDLVVGQAVFSIGNASGYQNTLQQGLISAFREGNGVRLIQVSASINFGNSGGPILDDQARVIGVAAAKIAAAENLGFAIPIDYVKGLVDSKTETPFPTFAALMKEALAKAAANRAAAGGAVTPNGNGGGAAVPQVGVVGGILGGIPGGAAPPPPPPPVRIASTRPAPAFTRIETFAGHMWRFSGDGMPALQVPLGHLHGLASDSSGNLYATDTGSQAIVKIDTTGHLHILLGPDSPPADRPFNPQSIAVDGTGTVYFGEDGQRVRKIMPNGEVITVAGGDKRGFTPDGSQAAGALLSGVTGIAFAPDGTVVFSEWGNSRVRRVDANGMLQTVAGDGEVRFAGDGGPASQSSLGHPMGLAVDSRGNIYIADQWNHRVRKVSRDGIITTVAGGGVGKEQISCPMGVAVDARGGLYTTDPCRRLVYVARGGDNVILGGNGSSVKEPSGFGGPATAASFDEWGIAVDAHDNVFVAGPDYGRIYRIAPDAIFSAVAGTGTWRAPQDGAPGSEAYFQGRLHLAADGTRGLIVSDEGANRIYRITNKGIVSRVAGSARPYYSGENTTTSDSGLDQPMGVRLRPNGSIVFAERGNSNRIREITPDGKIHTLAGTGRREYAGDGGKSATASLSSPNAVCIDSAGVIYVADTGNNRIRKIMTNGMIELLAGNGMAGFSGDGGPAERASFNTPVGIEVGMDGSVYVADAGNHRIRKISPNGIITTLAGDGMNRSAGDGGPAIRASFVWAYSLAWGADGALYVSDSNAPRVRRIDLSTGVITAVAGNGRRDLSGDGGPPLEAGLGNPEGFAIDPTGNIYLGDSRSGVIRVIHASEAAPQLASSSTGADGNARGGGPAAQPQPQATPPIQVGADPMESLIRSKIGVWDEENAKTILGAVREQKPDAQGVALTFSTPGTAFSGMTLHFASGKLVSTDLVAAHTVKWSVQLAYMKNKYPSDQFRVEPRGDNIAYTFPASKTTFIVQPDGTIAGMTVF